MASYLHLNNCNTTFGNITADIMSNDHNVHYTALLDVVCAPSLQLGYSLTAVRRPLRNDCAAPFLPSAADVTDLVWLGFCSKRFYLWSTRYYHYTSILLSLKKRDVEEVGVQKIVPLMTRTRVFVDRNSWKDAWRWNKKGFFWGYVPLAEISWSLFLIFLLQERNLERRKFSFYHVLLLQFYIYHSPFSLEYGIVIHISCFLLYGRWINHSSA